MAIELLPSEARAYGSEQLGLLWRDATAPILDDVGRTMRRILLGHRSPAAPAPGSSAATL